MKWAAARRKLAVGGGRFRNMEALTVNAADLITEVQVYFGGGV